MKARKSWSSKEQQRFIELYRYFTNKFLSVIFDRTEKAMKRRGQQLGLKKDNNSSHFAAGYIPFNKGKTGLNNRAKFIESMKKRKRIIQLRNEYGLDKILDRLKAHSAIELIQ